MRAIPLLAALLAAFPARAADNKFVNEQYDLQKIADQNPHLDFS